MTWAPTSVVLREVVSWGISHNVIVRRWFGEAHCRMVERRQLMDCGVPPLTCHVVAVVTLRGTFPPLTGVAPGRAEPSPSESPPPRG